jgi:hypothetical protein
LYKIKKLNTPGKNKEIKMRRAQIIVDENEQKKKKKNLFGNLGYIKKIKKLLLSKVANSTSFFKSVEFYIDHLSRKKVNSWNMFFESVYIASSHFTLEKMTEEEYLEEVSIRIDVLVDKYQKFCTKNGIPVEKLKSRKEVLKKFKLEIIEQHTLFTSAYTNIRWKGPSEKMEENKLQNLRISTELLENDISKCNFIQKFLELE